MRRPPITFGVMTRFAPAWSSLLSDDSVDERATMKRPGFMPLRRHRDEQVVRVGVERGHEAPARA